MIVSGTSQDLTRLNIAKELGAHTIVDVFTQDLQEIVAGLTEGIGVDVAVECSGAPSAVNPAIKVLKKMGNTSRLVLSVAM